MKAAKSITSVTLALFITACVDQQGQTPDKVSATEPERIQQQPPRTGETTPVDTLITEIATEQDALPHPVAPAAKLKHARQELAYSAADMASRGIASNIMIAPYPQPMIDRENYLHYEHNGVKVVAEQPVSTFSVDVDTASYANVRRMLVREGRLPPSDAVRLEEMINYFSYSYETPESTAQPFSITTELAPAPWSDRHQLLQIGLKGFEPLLEQRPPANLVFLVDVSGSMQSADKLGLVKKSLRLLVNKMNAQDRIALAVYAGAAGTVLESTPGNEKAKILAAIDGLQAGGSTHGSAGIKLAYALAEQYQIEGGINRVIIASDGDLNVGTVNIEALKNLVEHKRKSGIALTTLGFGSGNYNYALMEQLADVGNGNASYIDSLKEAQKVLVNEMQSTLLTIASDVKIQVEFNPALVSEYRLIGYENRMLNREDFSNDKVDAGDIGAGHTVTALYEIVLAGSGGERISNLRYTTGQNQAHSNTGELAFVKLRYKQPGESRSVELSRAISSDAVNDSIDNSSDDLRFAASVAGFGQILQGGTFTGDWSYSDALALARNSRGADPHGYRSEFVHLIELAQSLSSGT
jgi:Ca-activated chloride channel family protein